MPAKPTTNTINCGACGSVNTPDMSFCTACGKVLSARMAAQRQARGVKKRECTSCKKADELNNRYCIFCGAEIQKRQIGQGNSAALEKFTQEISGVKDRRMAGQDKPDARNAAAAVAQVQAHSPAAVAKPGSYGMALAVYLTMALVSAAGVVFLSKVNVARAFFTFVSPVKSGLVLYTKEPFVDVVIESADKKSYLLGSTGRAGSLALADLDSGAYLARFSKTGFETISQTIEIDKNRVNILGFDVPIELPPQAGGTTDK